MMLARIVARRDRAPNWSVGVEDGARHQWRGRRRGGAQCVVARGMADAAQGVDKDAAQSIAMKSLSLQDVNSCFGGGGGDQSRTRTVEINRNQGAPNEIVRLAFGRLPEKWDGPCEITGFVPWENARVSGKLRPGELMIFFFNLSSRLRYHTLNVR